MKKFFNDNKRNPWFWAFIFVALFFLVLMPVMSQSAGNSGDEDGFQIPQGENVLNYYKTDHQDTTCMTFENLKYYGCSFDVVMAWVNNTFHVNNINTTRHAANAFLGWVVVLFVGLIAYRMGGWKAGVLAMILMFISPRFLGHSFNNPKDIPLAAGVIMSIYYIMMFFRQCGDKERKMPEISTMIMLAISIALAISTRIGGLIIIGYFGLWGLLWAFTLNTKQELPSKGKNQKNAQSSFAWDRFGAALLWAIAICIVGFFFGLLLWPYAMQSPIKNSIESYHAMSQFAIAIRQIYEGQMVWSDALPWYYTPKFILTTIPVVVILGWILNLVFGWKNRGLARVEKIMMIFCFVFPVIWIVYTKANVYGGWRHSLFAYPPMVAAAALGFSSIMEKLNGKKGVIVSSIVWAVVALLSAGPIRHICSNHPYEYIYFNELTGGTKNAFGKYEMDYYYHSMREATEWVLENADRSTLKPGEKNVIGTWHIASTKYFIHNDTTQFQAKFIRWYQRGDSNWDYAVFPLTGIAPEYMKSSKVFPPKETVHTIEVDGQPIALVLKRQDRNDYYGAQMKEKRNIDSAFYFFRKALDFNPYNESVLLNMAELYLMTNQPDSTIAMCNRFLEFEPTNDNANYFVAYAYLLKQNPNKALEICQQIKEHNYKYASAYQLCMNIYLQQNNVMAAENEIYQLMDCDQINEQLVQTYLQLQKSKGLDDRMAYVGFYNAMVKSLEKRGKKREAKQYREVLERL